MGRIKLLVCPHNRYQVFCFAEIYDVVCITREHMNCLDLISRNLKIKDLIASDPSLLNQAVSCNYNEELPFCIMPVLTLCDAGV